MALRPKTEEWGRSRPPAPDRAALRRTAPSRAISQAAPAHQFGPLAAPLIASSATYAVNAAPHLFSSPAIRRIVCGANRPPAGEARDRTCSMAGLALPNAAASRRVANPAAVSTAFAAHKPRHVVHLAAQAGVRWSIEHPFAYADSTLTGFLSVLEACRHQEVEHFLYACSSSVYDGDAKLPYATADSVDHPVSLYAATKKAGALMAHAYAHLYGLPATRLRFFTVCGPWGRPDMACWKFAEAILEGRPIDVHSHGDMARDPPMSPTLWSRWRGPSRALLRPTPPLTATTPTPPAAGRDD